MNQKDLRDLEQKFNNTFGPNSEFVRSINSTVEKIQQTISNSAAQTSSGNRSTSNSGQTPFSQSPPHWTPAPPVPKHSYSPKKKQKIPGSASGTALYVLGIIFSILFIPPAIFSLFPLDFMSFLATAIVFSPLVGGSLFMLFRGIHLRRRTRRFRRYQQVIRGSSFCPIGLLESAVDRSHRFVVRDLKKMIQKGLFPDAHIDPSETTLMLDFNTYQQYLNAEAAHKQRQNAAQKAAQPKPPAELTELQIAVAEGKNYLQKIRSANDAIPGEEISQKLFRLEAVTTKIFDYVQNHEEKLPEIRKFMSYYLPTTLKLVEAYREFDAQPIQGNNITTVKHEIEASLDTINKAFENLLDSLFEDDAFDISTDISALKTMLEQEGLTGGRDDFQKPAQK